MEAVLDPTWQSPYSPSNTERDEHLASVRAFARRQRTPYFVAYGVSAVVLIAGAVWWSPVLWALLALELIFAVWDTWRVLQRSEEAGQRLGDLLLGEFPAGGSTKDRQRLVTVAERLTATFGVDGVSAFIVNDPGYNAALVPNGTNYSLFVTSAMMRDFELIELEGVVAHCLARQRLGMLPRQAAAAMLKLSATQRAQLAGVGLTYRADEVAGSAIRYPLGIADALRKISHQALPSDSYFASSRYDVTRWVWFNIRSDATTSDLSSLDDVELRAMALEEW